MLTSLTCGRMTMQGRVSDEFVGIQAAVFSAQKYFKIKSTSKTDNFDLTALILEFTILSFFFWANCKTVRIIGQQTSR